MQLNRTALADIPCYFADRPGRTPECTGTIPTGQPCHSIGADLICIHCVRFINGKERGDKSILVRVELRFSDGTVRWLEGDDADDWDNACTTQGSLAFVHGQAFPRLNWQERKGT